MLTRSLSATDLQALLGTPPLRFPAYRDLAERIRYLVVDGRLTIDVRLPSERELARVLRLSRSTVTAAYTHLVGLGFLRSRQGAGNFVQMPEGPGSNRLAGVGRSSAGQLNMAFASPSAPAGISAAYADALEQLPTAFRGHGYSPEGLFQLREQLAAWYSARGLPTDPEQIVVTSGAQSALNIVAATLLGPGDRVVTEAPSYANALDALRRRGSRLMAYPLPAEGWDPAGFYTTLRQTSPRIAYLIPEFHNPTGAWLAERARTEMAAALRRTQTTAVVDETLVEMRLDGQQPRRPLSASLPDGITIGSASKAFWGGLRVGWIRAPRGLVRALVETRVSLDLGTPPLEQLVVTALLAEPGSMLEDQRTCIRGQRDHLVQLLQRELPDWKVDNPGGGLTLWVGLPAETSSRLAAAAERRNLLVSAGPRFFPSGGGERHMRLPYTAPADVLDEVVRRLALAWNDIFTDHPSSRSRDPLAVLA